MALKVRQLHWVQGTPSRIDGVVHFDRAVTPFGEYKAWLDGELWGPTDKSTFIGNYDTPDGAKAAAQEHLQACIVKLLEVE